MHPWRYTSTWDSPSLVISWGVDVDPWPLDPLFGQFFLTCVQAIPGNGFSWVWTSYDIWRLPLPPLFFWFFFFGSLFGWSPTVVISSLSGLFSFSLSKIPSPLVFALTGWKCQTARLGKGRSTVARSYFKHFIDPRLLRRDGRPWQGRFQQRRLNPRAERPIPSPRPAPFSSL